MSNEELEKQALSEKEDTSSLDNKCKYNVCRTKGGMVVGMCDDYEGFVTCVTAVCANKDISFPHNADKSDFCCKDASDRVLYYPQLVTP